MNNKQLTPRDIAKIIDAIAPEETQSDWDNSGLIIGIDGIRVKRILTCLEVNHEVVEEAKSAGADMIVSHHPLIFGSIQHIRQDEPTGKVLIDLIGSGISVYSSHTPFDKVKGGNNDALASSIGLSSVKPMEDTEEICRIGKFDKAITFKETIDLVCNQLELSLRDVRAVGELDAVIETVGMCTGAGAEFIPLAASKGCQLFITGDVKYHEAQMAKELGICVIDAGHYGTEKSFPDTMKAKLEKKLGDKVEVIASQVDLDPFVRV
jgi:dinuclear metal center YbgI/SA1388 family protein